jgi:hypothetical protein
MKTKRKNDIDHRVNRSRAMTAIPCDDGDFLS